MDLENTVPNLMSLGHNLDEFETQVEKLLNSNYQVGVVKYTKKQKDNKLLQMIESCYEIQYKNLYIRICLSHYDYIQSRREEVGLCRINCIKYPFIIQFFFEFLK